MSAILNNLRLAKKLLISFGFLSVLVIAQAINGYASNVALGGIARQHVESSVAGMSKLADVISDIKEMRIIVYSYYNATDQKDAAKLRERIDKAAVSLRDDIAGFAKVAPPAFAGETAKLLTIANGLQQTNDRIFAASDTDKKAGLALIKGEGKERSHDAIEQTEKLLKLSRETSQAANAAGMDSARTALMMTIALSILTVVGLFGVWLAIDRTVARPMAQLADTTKVLAQGGTAMVPSRDREDELGEIANAVEQFRLAAAQRADADAHQAAEQRAVTAALSESLTRVSRGDLTADVQADFPPAYAELKSNLNNALASLRELIGAVIESTSAIRTGSGEIAAASEDLARRTEANAAALEQTAAAATQMDQRLKATAAAAGRTVARADGAIQTVSGGRAIADDAMQAMTRVAESAKGIDGVIEGLDKIAFQTRVLAMNAAVEAGRAGEAGRGFAVVADLVSALAMRAEEEAGRARDQLTATQSDIVAAVDMVEKVDGALANISTDVGEVHQLLGAIAGDNQAQSSAISEISQTIGTMDQSTQQNAAMVEETSAAARNLTNEVAQLEKKATRFSIQHAGSSRPATRPAPSRSARPARPATGGYVSPVRPLPVATASVADGDWTAF